MEKLFKLRRSVRFRGIQVGTLCVIGKASGVNQAGEVGVVYELYSLADDEGPYEGCSIIFERGGHDGFHPDDLKLFDVRMLPVVCPDVSDYRFTNVTRLSRDYERGVFDKAFGTARRYLASSEKSRPFWIE